MYFRPELGFTLLNEHQLYSDSKFLNSVLPTNIRDKLTESQVSLDALFGFQTKLFSIEVGPQLGVVTGAVINSVSKTIAYNGTFYDDNKTDFKKDNMAKGAVFSVLLGVCKRDINRNFGAGLFYNLGFRNLWSLFPDHLNLHVLRLVTAGLDIHCQLFVVVVDDLQCLLNSDIFPGGWADHIPGKSESIAGCIPGRSPQYDEK